jgi:hypothetical protein
MALMIAELYDALKEAGAGEESARKAAEAVAAYEDRLARIEISLAISRIRLSDKTSRLRPRLAAPTRGQAYETVIPVEVREWISPAPASPDLVLVAQPPAQPHGCVVVERPIRFGD